jgi:tetratricopeptide (TPR) repeat protein
VPKSCPQDWYRNTEWNDEIAAAFHAKLARARSQKPQYLCIQAGSLAKRHPDAALGLIDQYLETDDTFHLANARNVQGQAYLALDQLDPAVSAFKQALLREEEFPNVTSNTRLDFPRLVALRQIRAEYDYALDILN